MSAPSPAALHGIYCTVSPPESARALAAFSCNLLPSYEGSGGVPVHPRHTAVARMPSLCGLVPRQHWWCSVARGGAGPPMASCNGSALTLGDLWSVFEPGIIKPS